MKNTKGMTLIEVIISLLIISTASLIIVVGFVFTDSNHYKDVTNKQQKALVDEENKDTDIDVDDTLANYSITVNESGNPIIVNGTYKKATSKTYKDVNLSNFIPKILDLDLVDEVITVSTDDAYEAARILAKKEGLLVGITAGAALHGATKITDKNKNIVVLLPDTGERYLSTTLFE